MMTPPVRIAKRSCRTLPLLPLIPSVARSPRNLHASEIRATPNPEPPIANGSFQVPESLGRSPYAMLC